MSSKINIHKKSLAPIRIEDRFYSKANTLRAHFDSRFKDPLSTRSDRFIWDYWLVPKQYKHLRTPAESFFPKPIFDEFLNHLLNWGRENLGCQMISHPWLSAYVDGCNQSLHSDVPHGPWAFVYSITPWENRKFKGGETIIAKPKLLNYFEQYRHDQSDEKNSLFTEVEPKFNRLTLFDPRYPHGVNTVTGEDDIRKSRLVIHGWFTEPRPMIEGSLTLKKALPYMDEVAATLIAKIEAMGFFGLLSIRLKISSTGQVQSISVLCGHLIDDKGAPVASNALSRILNTLLSIHFPKSIGMTLVTLPIEFRK